MMEPLTPRGSEDAFPLSERMPDYLVTFGIGFAVSAGIGILVWVISDIPLVSTVGYTVILYGVVLLLAGGSAGGGYSNLGMGAMGALFGTRRADEVQPEVNSSYKPTPRERLEQGLRPEANPRAFWQVVAGGLYITLGLFILIVGS
ncbi:MAG: hypothetical protein BMS9Abin20_0297 [Acidimicrobiia bacterium]|nr:MAG: hypothetical protein BMS9Abin20_0297 [Acidimicrobiia bacterium]